MAHKCIGYGSAEEPANQNGGQKSRDGAYLCNDAAQCSCLTHIFEPTRQAEISYDVFCLTKK